MKRTLPEVQAMLISRLKAAPTVTSLLLDVKEVREVEWVGKSFTYPNIRVRVGTFRRVASNCDRFVVEASCYVFGEDASSKLTNTIATAIYDLFDTVSSAVWSSIQVTGITAVQVGAMQTQEGQSWVSEVQLHFQVS